MTRKQFIYGLIGISSGLLIACAYLIFPRKTWLSYEDVVRLYVQSLVNNDEASLMDLLPNEAEFYDISQGRQLARAQLKKYGGRKIEQVQITYNKVPAFKAPGEVVLDGATITGIYQENGETKKFFEKVRLLYDRGPFWRFYRGTWSIYLAGYVPPSLGVKPAIVP